jgi:hypothetical protein
MQTEKIMTYLKKAMEEILGYLKVKEPIRILKDYVPAIKIKINGICDNVRFLFVTISKPSSADTHKQKRIKSPKYVIVKKRYIQPNSIFA